MQGEFEAGPPLVFILDIGVLHNSGVEVIEAIDVAIEDLIVDDPLDSLGFDILG